MTVAEARDVVRVHRPSPDEPTVCAFCTRLVGAAAGPVGWKCASYRFAEPVLRAAGEPHLLVDEEGVRS